MHRLWHRGESSDLPRSPAWTPPAGLAESPGADGEGAELLTPKGMETVAAAILGSGAGRSHGRILLPPD